MQVSPILFPTNELPGPVPKLDRSEYFDLLMKDGELTKDMQNLLDELVQESVLMYDVEDGKITIALFDDRDIGRFLTRVFPFYVQTSNKLLGDFDPAVKSVVPLNRFKKTWDQLRIHLTERRLSTGLPTPCVRYRVWHKDEIGMYKWFWDALGCFEW